MNPPTHLTDYLQKNAQETPDKLALVTEHRSMTWLDLWQAVEAGAAFLGKKLPKDKQAVVGLLVPNTWQHVVANLSIVHAGHIAMPIDVIFKPLEIRAVIEQMSPELLITDDEGQARIGDITVPIINMDKLDLSAPEPNGQYLRLSPDRQIASLFFTSGTTGQPKVVPNTHSNHIWNIEVCSKVWNWTSQDSQLVSSRLSHMLGLILGLSGGLYHGNTTYLQDRFNAESTLELLSGGQITMFSHGPLVYAKLLEASVNKEYDLSKVRLFISGSGPLAPAIWQQFKDKFDAEILEVYGTTESGRIASNLLNERIPGSPGRILPGAEVKTDEQGQVLVRSKGLFPGYWHNSTATQNSMTKDGFYKTGDLGEIKNGRLVLKGRVQEKIRRQGYTISPRDIEWALHNDTRVKEVVVVGAQQPDAPNDLLAYFVVGNLAEDDVRAFCQVNLPSVWRPDQIFMLEQLPRTRTGKPDLNKLKAMIN